MSTPSSEETIQQVIDRFWMTIPPMWNHIRGNIRAVGAENYDITVEQFHLLRHIRRGICCVSDLAEARMTSRPAVSQAVDVLVDKGLVTRETDPTDRRFVRLALTPAAQDLIAAIFKKNRAWMRERLVNLEPGELETLISAMDILHKTFVSTEPVAEAH